MTYIGQINIMSNQNGDGITKTVLSVHKQKHLVARGFEWDCFPIVKNSQ